MTLPVPSSRRWRSWRWGRSRWRAGSRASHSSRSLRRAATEVLIAMIAASKRPSSKSSLSRSRAAHDRHAGDLRPQLSGCRRRSPTACCVGAGAAKMSMTWVAPRPAPMTSTRSTPARRLSGAGSSAVVARCVAAAAAAPRPSTVMRPAGVRRGQIHAQLLGPLGALAVARTRPAAPRPRAPGRRAASAACASSAAASSKSSAIGSVSAHFVLVGGQLQQVAVVRGDDLDDRLAGLDLHQTALRVDHCPVFDEPRDDDAVSLLTSVVGTMTGFIRPPPGWRVSICGAPTSISASRTARGDDAASLATTETGGAAGRSSARPTLAPRPRCPTTSRPCPPRR